MLHRGDYWTGRGHAAGHRPFAREEQGEEQHCEGNGGLQLAGEAAGQAVLREELEEGDAETAGEGERKALELAHDRGGRHDDDEERQRGWVERAIEGNDEDAGEGGKAASDRARVRRRSVAGRRPQGGASAGCSGRRRS